MKYFESMPVARDARAILATIGGMVAAGLAFQGCATLPTEAPASVDRPMDFGLEFVAALFLGLLLVIFLGWLDSRSNKARNETRRVLRDSARDRWRMKIGALLTAQHQRFDRRRVGRRQQPRTAQQADHQQTSNHAEHNMPLPICRLKRPSSLNHSDLSGRPPADASGA